MAKNFQRYKLRPILNCNMCCNYVDSHKILGQRLNKSQGLHPKKRTGITTTIVKCTNCDLIYSNPQPIPENLQDHYGVPPEDYWKPEYFNIDPIYFSGQIQKAKELINFQQGMKALDIGAGIGKGMLAMSNAGFETFGFEPSETFRQKAIEEMKINPDKIKLGGIEDVDFPENSFEFISFGAVLEHLYDPNESIKKAIHWLKPNGIIHIEVPSSKYLIVKLFNLYYRIIGTNYVSNLSPMHEPYHLFEFSLKSFKKNGKILNYKISNYEYSVASIYHIPKVFHPILKWIMKKTNTGMQLTVWLKKNKI